MNTPAVQSTGNTVGEKIRTVLARPGLALAAVVAVGFGLAGATAIADAASAAPAGPSAMAGRADGKHDKRPGADDKATDDKAAKDKAAEDEKSKRDGGRKARPAWVSPMADAKTTSCFGPRWGTQHKGLDLALPENSPVNAAGAGTVVAEGWVYQGYGISVVVDHGDGHLTHYAHLNRTTVAAGDRVRPGDRIGVEGNTGDSTGPHLHFEVHRGMWNQLDPGPWMKERGVDLKC